ncbi:MAG: transposase [Candidatus Nitrosopolaris sp.]
MPGNKSSWHEYSESLIERGHFLIDIGFLKLRNKEIKSMNEGKVGAPYEYPDSYIQFLAFLKLGFRIPYRTVQGIVRGLSEYVKISETYILWHSCVADCYLLLSYRRTSTGYICSWWHCSCSLLNSQTTHTSSEN